MKTLWPYALFFGLFVGCAGRTCPRIRHTDPDVALRYHDTMRAHVRSLRAHANVDQFNRKGRIRGTVSMFVERPNRLRFDVMTQLGPAAVLSTHGTDFALVDLRRRLFTHGPVCPANIAALMGVAMTADQLSLLLLAQVPQIDANSARLACTGDGYYRIKRFGVDGSRQEIDLEVREADEESPLAQQRLRLARVEFYDARGETEWRVTYKDYKVIRGPHETQGVAMPFSVRLQDPKRGGDTLVSFKEIAINIDVPEQVFVQSPPPGMRVRPAVCP